MQSLRTTASARLCAIVLTSLCAAPLQAQVSEDAAKQALTELRLLVTEGTGVVGDLQGAINGAKVAKDDVAPAVLLDKLKARYQKASGASLDAPATGLAADTRRAYLDAYTAVLSRSQGPIVKGGQDAFVPAHFRALVLKEFNGTMKGKVQAYATNRSGELINEDWGVQRVMKGSPLVGEVDKAMATGSLDPIVKRSGDRMLGYWPMKLGPACVACHAQNGLKQTEGGFGGALVAEIAVK